MGELTIRRNRGFTVPRYQSVEKTEKQSAGSASRKASGKTGFMLSETMRQLMTKVSQLESRSREGHRTLQTGEAVLDEVQEKLGRMAELAEEAASGKNPDYAALQSELDKLQKEVGRMIASAVAGGTQLFLDEDTDARDGMDALLLSVLSGASAKEEASQALPDWLMSGITQDGFSSDEILHALGLDRTASGAQLLAAITGNALTGGSAAGFVASLYLGAVIAGGSSGSIDPSQALDGLRQLLEKVAEGTSPDEAIEALTNGEFTSLEDFQTQFTSGAAPGLQAFLMDLLLSDGGSTLLTDVSLLSLLAGAGGMNLDLMMELLSAVQSAAESPEAPAADAMAETVPAEAAPQRASVLELGNVQVVGRDLSGVSFDSGAGVLTVAGTADVLIQGTGRGEQAIQITGSGTVTIQNVNASTVTVNTPAASLSFAGINELGELRLDKGVSLTIGGSGLLAAGTLRADASNTLRLTGGAVAVREQTGQASGILTVPVILEGPASLMARAASVQTPGGKALEPMDLVWKAFLPGFEAITSMTVDGRHARMALTHGDASALARLWLEKGDPSSHGYPVHALVVRGRDASGQPKTRYAYLLWNQQAGAFEEVSMYPNPFTITGGEEDTDWVYEEESHTLRILSAQVTAVSGGAGTDATQTPFSGRIALADSIGSMELTLGGVVCRVSGGRAFHLGQENDVTLLLQSGTDNCFESGAGFAGISLGDGTSLRIDRAEPRNDSRSPAGTLTATGGAGGAGIGRDGGGSRDRTSRILICGGVIQAVGAGGGAGIGAGKHGAMGPVTITGGTVTSSGGRGGAGIGAGLGAPVGDISIRGGMVTATAACHAAAIGAGVQGESGNILITGTARILKAVGGDPGADIGACLFGGCGKVDITGGADIGGAGLRTRAGISLPMGEDTVTLPQFRLSTRTLQLDGMSISSREDARKAGQTIDADRRWVSQIQEAYNTLYTQMEQSFGGVYSVRRYVRRTGAPVRDPYAANALLADIRESIPLQPAQAMQTHSQRGPEDVRQLLR